jgi:cell division protein FtsI/penicillin-binding protein 2
VTETVLRTPAKIGRVERPGKKKDGKKRETEPTISRARMQVRVVGLAVLVAVFFVVLAFQLWYLQVLTGEENEATAQNTQTRSVKIPAQRGVIYDRDGEVLANNMPGLSVTIIPNAIPREKVEELADVLDADKEAVLARYDAAEELGNQYSPMLLKENASREDVMYVSERTERYDGLVVNDDYIRNYPNSELASHVLGYTGAITEEELEEGTFEGMANDSVIGKGGVELAYEEILRGEPGKKEYNVDALGRQVAVRSADGRRYDGSPEEIPEQGRPARITDPEPGKDVRLTVDMDLQETAEEELGAALERTRANGTEGTGGAVVAIDPTNGEIRAMASRPTFDPQIFVDGISGSEEIQQFEYLNSEEAHAPFTNRAVQGAYPGASAFKPFTGMAGLEEGTIGPGTTVTDTGECWRPTGSSWGCWQSWRENSPKYWALGPHGTQNYAQSLGDSNDKFFYQVVDWMWNGTDDEDLFPKWLQQFGFGARGPSRRERRTDSHPRVAGGDRSNPRRPALDCRPVGQPFHRAGRPPGHPAATRPGLRGHSQRRYPGNAARGPGSSRTERGSGAGPDSGARWLTRRLAGDAEHDDRRLQEGHRQRRDRRECFQGCNPADSRQDGNRRDGRAQGPGELLRRLGREPGRTPGGPRDARGRRSLPDGQRGDRGPRRAGHTRVLPRRQRLLEQQVFGRLRRRGGARKPRRGCCARRTGRRRLRARGGSQRCTRRLI